MFHAATALVEGFQSHIKGIRFGFGHLSFLGLAAIPFLVTVGLYVFGFYLFNLYADSLLNLVWHLDAGETSSFIVRWLHWTYMHVVKYLLYMIVLAVMFYSFIVFSNVLASPVYDYISTKYEQTYCPDSNKEQETFSMKRMLDVIKEELKKAVFMLAIPLLLVFIPIIGTFLSFMTAAVFLAWDYVDFSLSRDCPLLKDRINALWHHRYFFIGFGIPLLIPFLGLMILPFAILGSTVFYYEKMKAYDS